MPSKHFFYKEQTEKKPELLTQPGHTLNGVRDPSGLPRALPDWQLVEDCPTRQMRNHRCFLKLPKKGNMDILMPSSTVHKFHETRYEISIFLRKFRPIFVKSVISSILCQW